MAEARTFGELFKTKAITDADLDAAVDAYVADPTLTLFMIGEGYGIDLAAAIADSVFATGMVTKANAKLASKRSAVRTAILLAWPVKG